ncbi:MAG: hypothetical protein IIZ45_01545 [Firmicutes bacterium]|nr:hypothetical protein [Bacillota bacterium]
MKACVGVKSPCGDDCALPGYGFVMVQDVTRVYDYESALFTGTAFPDLCYPKGKYGPNENFR